MKKRKRLGITLGLILIGLSSTVQAQSIYTGTIYETALTGLDITAYDKIRRSLEPPPRPAPELPGSADSTSDDTADDVPSAPTYVVGTNQTQQRVELFTIADGRLQPASGTPLAVAATEQNPCTARIHPNNQLVIVGHCDGEENIVAYKLDTVNQTLSRTGTVRGGLLTGNIVFSVDGLHAYATQADADPALGVAGQFNAVLTIEINPETGELTSLRSVAIPGAGASGLGVSRDGTVLLVANSLGQEVHVFDITQAIPRLIRTIPTEPHPVDLAVDPLNRFFAVVYRDIHRLAVFKPDPMGNISVAEADTCPWPRVVLFNAAGNRVFVLCDVPGLVDDFEINDKGEPRWQAHATTGSTASRAMSMAHSEDILLIVNGFERTTNYGETVRGFRIERRGLTAIDPALPTNGIWTDVAATDPDHRQATSSPTVSPAPSVTSAESTPPTPPVTSAESTPPAPSVTSAESTPPAPPVTSAESTPPAPPTPTTTPSPTLALPNGGGGGGCNMVPAHEGAPVPWLAAFDHFGLPCMALALMRTLRWRRGKR